MTSAIARRTLLVGAAAPLLAACGGGASDGASADGKVTVEPWHGQNDTGRKAVEALVAEFNRTHPRVRVDSSSGGVVADAMLQKVTAALARGLVSRYRLRVRLGPGQYRAQPAGRRSHVGGACPMPGMDHSSHSDMPAWSGPTPRAHSSCPGAEARWRPLQVPCCCASRPGTIRTCGTCRTC